QYSAVSAEHRDGKPAKRRTCRRSSEDANNRAAPLGTRENAGRKALAPRFGVLSFIETRDNREQEEKEHIHGGDKHEGRLRPDKVKVPQALNRDTHRHRQARNREDKHEREHPLFLSGYEALLKEHPQGKQVIESGAVARRGRASRRQAKQIVHHEEDENERQTKGGTARSTATVEKLWQAHPRTSRLKIPDSFLPWQAGRRLRAGTQPACAQESGSSLPICGELPAPRN